MVVSCLLRLTQCGSSNRHFQQEKGLLQALWNVPLTPLVNMLQPDNLFAYQCRPPPTQHLTPTIKILFPAAFYAAPEKHYFIPQIFVKFIKMIKRASVSYLHFQFPISPACWVQSAQCGCCAQRRARVTQFLFPLQSTSNTTSVPSLTSATLLSANSDN